MAIKSDTLEFYCHKNVDGHLTAPTLLTGYHPSRHPICHLTLSMGDHSNQVLPRFLPGYRIHKRTGQTSQLWVFLGR